MTTAGLASVADGASSPSSSSRSPSSERAVAELVVSAQAGNRAAFAALYERFHRMVHAVVLSSVRSQNEDARDLVQDVFAKALRELASVDDPRRFGGWLAAIARRSAIDVARASARTRRNSAEAGEDELANLGRAPPPTSEALEALRAIRDLPEAYRETMMMRLLEGLTGPEIAELTGMTPESVRVNLCRGMRLLRARLTRGGSSGDPKSAEVTA